MDPLLYNMASLGRGSALQRWLNSGGDVGVLRPWMEIDERTGQPTGNSCLTVQKRRVDGTPLYANDGQPDYMNIYTNAPSVFTQEDWMVIDETIVMAEKAEVGMWEFFRQNPVTIGNGFGVLSLKRRVGDATAVATISMDPIRKSDRSRPVQDEALLPLPIIHGEGSFTARELAVSRRSGWRGGLDTTMISETVYSMNRALHSLCLGTASSFTDNGATIYGLINHPSRYTKTLTAPTGSNNTTILTEIVDMTQTLINSAGRFRGPFVALYSKAYNAWLDLDYGTNYPKTLRQRIGEVAAISRWQLVEDLSGYQIILVDTRPSVLRGVEFLPMTAVQWEEEGGQEQLFKLMMGRVPELRTDYNGLLGVIHGAVP